MNAVEIEEAISALAAEPFDSTEFPYEFLEAFGSKATTIKRLRTGNSNKSDIDGGVLQHNNIHMAVCPTGEVIQTLDALRQSPATNKQKAKFVLATDGEDFQAEDLMIQKKCRKTSAMPTTAMTKFWNASISAADSKTTPNASRNSLISTPK